MELIDDYIIYQIMDINYNFRGIKLVQKQL
jgi:hypothetical protein